MSNKGHDRERQVRRFLEGKGWWVCRAAGSLGDADLVALKAGLTRWEKAEALLIEVKATARGPYHGFGPARRDALVAAALLAGAEARLAWWPPRGKLTWLHEEEWPATQRPE